MGMAQENQSPEAKALQRIHKALDGVEWSADTLDEIAEAVRAAGRTIHEPGFYDVVSDTYMTQAWIYIKVDREREKIEEITIAPYQQDPEYQDSQNREGQYVQGIEPAQTIDELHDMWFDFMDTRRIERWQKNAKGEVYDNSLYMLAWEG